METIKISSLPLDEVIRDLAKAFNTSFIKNCKEYILEIPPNIGSGTIRGIQFEVGLGIILYSCSFKDGLEIQFVENKIHPLKFLYCLEGSFCHRFINDDPGKPHKLEKYQNAIVASQQHYGHVITFSPGVETVVNSLEIDREVFQPKVSCYIDKAQNDLQTLFKDIRAEDQFYHGGFYSLRLSDLFQEIKEFYHEDFLRILFLEGKSYQILTEQILEYRDDINEERSNILRASEQNLIKQAAELIQGNLGEYNTIESLSEKVGLNQNKMQQGFRLLYQMSVNEFVRDVRLKKTRELLANPEYNITEIVEKVGLSSKSYLTKTFKDKYGITPSEFRGKLRK